MSTEYAVEVVERATGDVVRRMDAKSMAQAERLERGLLINMDRDKFFTRITEGPQA